MNDALEHFSTKAPKESLLSFSKEYPRILASEFRNSFYCNYF